MTTCFDFFKLKLHNSELVYIIYIIVTIYISLQIHFHCIRHECNLRQSFSGNSYRTCNFCVVIQETLNKENETIHRVESATKLNNSSRADVSVASARTIQSTVRDHLGSRANSKQQPSGTLQQPKFDSYMWHSQRKANSAGRNLLFQQAAMLRLPQVPSSRKLPGFHSQKSLHRTNNVEPEPRFRFRAVISSGSSSSSESSSGSSDSSSDSDDE